MNVPLEEPTHAFPEDDFFQHEESKDCPCGPTELVVYGRGLVRNRVMRHKHVQGVPTPSFVPEGWS